MISVFFGFSILMAFGKGASAQSSDVALIDAILEQTPPDENVAWVDDMGVPVGTLRAWRDSLAGTRKPQLTLQLGVPLWPGGTVYYAFAGNISAAKQKIFQDAAAEWAMFANLHFIPRTTQTNFISVVEDASVSGGSSAVGMTGAEQFIPLGTNGWSHYVICHEIGHALGMIHEHQRFDRDSYILVITNNVTPGYQGLIKLGNNQSKTPYDFHSIMHYGAFTAPIDPSKPTMIPLPAYSNYAPVGADDPNLSAYDRLGMVLTYGPGPALSSVVTNTQDSGPGSLRAVLYYAYDHPGTVVTFNIPISDAGYSNGVFTIQVTDELPCLMNATIVDGATQTGGSIRLSGTLCSPFPRAERSKPGMTRVVPARHGPDWIR